MFNWTIKEEITAKNAIFLAEVGDNNGRPFKARFLQAGLVKYDFGVCLLKKETIDVFVNTFINQPVIIGHKDYIEEKDVVGYIHNIWFSPEDGWFWCDGKLIKEEAIEKIEKGYNVSCQYRITDFSDNREKKLHNGNPYDKEILNGVFEHLAIVECPRYEDAFIAVNAYIAENEDKWITIKPNGEEGKGRHLLLKDGETPAEAIQRVYGNKDQQTLFDTSGYKKTKEDYKKEKEDKQKEYDKIEENHKKIEKEKESKKQDEINQSAQDLTLEKFLNKHLEEFDGSYSKAMDYWEKHSKDYHTTSDENIINKHFKKEYEHYKGEKEETKYLDELKKSMDNVDSLNYSFEDVKRINEYINEAESADYDDFVKAMRKKYERLPLETNEEYFERERKGKPFTDKKQSDKEEKKERTFIDKKEKKQASEEWENKYRGSKKQRELYNTKTNELAIALLDNNKEKAEYLKGMTSILKERRDKNYINKQKEIFEIIKKQDKDLYNEPLIQGQIEALKIIEEEQTASNSFVEVFRNMLYETVAEGIVEHLIAANKNDKENWVTIKGNHILIKDGETLAEAFKRTTGVSLQKSNSPHSQKIDKHQSSKAYKQILEKLKEDNKKEITPQEIIENAVKNNKKYSAEEIREKIDFADSYNAGIKEKKRQTYQLYSNEKGEYQRERQEKHKEIINDLFKNSKAAKPKNGEAPTFIMLGGRGGSGKSKFGEEGNAKVYDKDNYIVLDADEIKKYLKPPYNGFNAYEVHEESSDILKQALNKAKKEGLNVVLDGTMAGFKSSEKKLKEFDKAGYNIEMYYMHLPREKSTERAIGRFMKEGGRYVPLDILLDMKDNEENFDNLKKYAKKWAFYNNDVERGQEPILVDKNN